jgi:hypothetical protein
MAARLGLRIASQVVARHGGAIEAAPAEERGTIVTVRLPLASVQRQEDPAAAAAQPAAIEAAAADQQLSIFPTAACDVGTIES